LKKFEYLDLDQFDENCNSIFRIAQQYNKKIRIATKSIRCVSLIERAALSGGSLVSGLMCFSIEEVKYLKK